MRAAGGWSSVLQMCGEHDVSCAAPRRCARLFTPSPPATHPWIACLPTQTARWMWQCGRGAWTGTASWRTSALPRPGSAAACLRFIWAAARVRGGEGKGKGREVGEGPSGAICPARLLPGSAAGHRHSWQPGRPYSPEHAAPGAVGQGSRHHAGPGPSGSHSQWRQQRQQQLAAAAGRRRVL